MGASGDGGRSGVPFAPQGLSLGAIPFSVAPAEGPARESFDFKHQLALFVLLFIIGLKKQEATPVSSGSRA